MSSRVLLTENYLTIGRKGVLGALVGSGARITTQRKLVASIIEEASSHPDADQIYRAARLRDPRISLSTVYRTLALLKSQGLIRDHRFDQEHAHFERVTGESHHHVICGECGAVREFELTLTGGQLSNISDQTGYEIRSERLEAVGICGKCRGGDTRARRP